MSIFKVENGCVDCYVIARSKENVLQLKAVQDYFYDEEDMDLLVVTECELDKELEINFEGTKITHTIREWEYIYDGFGEHLICQMITKKKWRIKK